MVIRRVGPLSVAKVAGLLYLILGLVIGAFVSLFSMAGLFGGPGPDSGFMPVLFGTGAVVLLPICYGFFGFLMALVMSGLFNAVVKLTGGVELDVS
jgi:hypothetical protein